MGEPAASAEEELATTESATAVCAIGDTCLLYGAATLAAITLAEDDAEQAARLVGTVEAAFEAANAKFQSYERDRHEALLATLRERLGPERFERMRAAGRAVALDEVFDAVV